jgi:hypothetical protein
MGGRLTEFDRYEKLTGWGTPRPVYGPKHSAVPIGSHIDNRPKLPQRNVNVGPRGVEISLEWAISNLSAHSVNADYRIRLNRRKGGNDETWFEYHPNKGVVKDIVSEKTGRAHKIITKHGASISPTKAKAIPIPGGRKTTMSIGFTIPGPAQGRDMQEFWKDRKESTFNLLVAVYQLTSDGPVELEKGEHEFSDILELLYDPSAPSTRVPAPSGPLYFPPSRFDKGPDVAPPRAPSYFPPSRFDKGPDVAPPRAPAPAKAPRLIPAWAQKHWDDPDREKVPTRRSKFGGGTVQTYDPDTGDPW